MENCFKAYRRTMPSATLTSRFHLVATNLSRRGDFGDAFLWDKVSGSLLHRWSEDSLGANSTAVAYSPSGELILYGTTRGIRAWRATDKVELWGTNVYPFGVKSLEFTPDGASFLTGESEHHSVRLRSVSNAAVLRTYTSHSGDVRAVCFSANGGMLASGSGTGDLFIWIP